MKKFAIIAILIFGCVVFYNYTTVSKDSNKYLSIADSISQQTNASSVIIVDFTKSSCSDRLFIFTDGKPIYSGAVLHGNGKGNTPSKPIFSNTPGSKCSSLGLFKVEAKRYMNNGYPCLVLEGLSPTNSNAKLRGILVHPSVMVTLLPFELKGACFPLTDSSNGCFSVSFHTFRIVEKLQKPVYLYAKYDN